MDYDIRVGGPFLDNDDIESVVNVLREGRLSGGIYSEYFEKAFAKFINVKYVKGDFLAAFDHRASDKNERMEISIDTEFGIIVVKQIAGLVARRILCYAKEGKKMLAGDRLGFIRFGSRTDIILPHNINLNIELNQKVYGGETILGTYES